MTRDELISIAGAALVGEYVKQGSDPADWDNLGDGESLYFLGPDGVDVINVAVIVDAVVKALNVTLGPYQPARRELAPRAPSDLECPHAAPSMGLTIHEQLALFARQVSDRNRWLEEGEYSVYVRKSKRVVNGHWAVTLDIATVSMPPEMQHQGRFTRLLEYAETLGMHVYVESAMQGLWPLLERRGYIMMDRADDRYPASWLKVTPE